MTRVSSFGHNQSMVNSLLQNQSRLFDVQRQINTGKKADEFRGYTREAETLLSARTLKSRTEGYVATAKDIRRKLDTNELQMEGMHDAADDLKQTIVDALGQNQAISFSESLQQAIASVLSSLNTQVNGNYIFAGSRTDTKPVAAQSLADLVAAPSVASLFQNDTEKLSGKVGDNVEVEYGLLASDIATDLLTSLKALADYDAGPFGPLNGPLTAAQRSFLQTEMANLTTAIDTVQSYISQNGLRQNRAEDVSETLEAGSNFLEVFISDIEDVNLTEAAMRLNGDQLALQASYSIMGQLSKLSLLNFL